MLQKNIFIEVELNSELIFAIRGSEDWSYHPDKTGPSKTIYPCLEYKKGLDLNGEEEQFWEMYKSNGLNVKANTKMFEPNDIDMLQEMGLLEQLKLKLEEAILGEV